MFKRKRLQPGDGAGECSGDKPAPALTHAAAIGVMWGSRDELRLAKLTKGWVGAEHGTAKLGIEDDR